MRGGQRVFAYKRRLEVDFAKRKNGVGPKSKAKCYSCNRTKTY